MILLTCLQLTVMYSIAVMIHSSPLKATVLMMIYSIVYCIIIINFSITKILFIYDYYAMLISCALRFKLYDIYVLFIISSVAVSTVQRFILS